MNFFQRKTMIINIDRLPEDGLKVSKDFEILSSELVEENVVFLEPVHASLSLRKVGEEIFIAGTVTTLLSFICCRCLSPFEFKVHSHFDHVYIPEELWVLKEELTSNDMNKKLYASHDIDIREIILEQLNFTFPTRPLCAKDCQGICPICGKIIKEGNCSCAANDADPRLEKFKIFLRDKR